VQERGRRSGHSGRTRAGQDDAAHDGPRLDLRILQAFRRIIRAIDLYSRKLAADHNITAPQLVALNAIVSSGPLYTSELAQRIHLSPSTVVGIVDRLEAKDLIRRQRSTADRRRVHVESTAAGRKLVEASPSPLQDRLAQALRTLPDQEQQEIAAALEKVVSLMEARELDAAPILETGSLLPDVDPT
jgi:DNA-binding MarR family transcriptional regulator